MSNHPFGGDCKPLGSAIKPGTLRRRQGHAAALWENDIADDAETLIAIHERILALEHGSRQTVSELAQLRADHDRLSKRFESMTKADEIAQAVTTAIEEQRRRRYTSGRKLAGAVAATILLVPAVHNAASWLFGL